MANTNIDMSNVTVADMNGKYIAVKIFSGSGDVYTVVDGDTRYNHVFAITDGKIYDGKLEEDEDTGVTKYVVDQKPVVELDTKQVTSVDGGEDTTVDIVRYVAKREDINVNPYDISANPVHESQIVGKGDHAKAVALLQALTKYMRSYQFFSYDAYVADMYELLDDLHEIVATSTTSTTTSTTTTTTTNPTTTTTSTSTTTTTTTAAGK